MITFLYGIGTGVIFMILFNRFRRALSRLDPDDNPVDLPHGCIGAIERAVRAECYPEEPGFDWQRSTLIVDFRPEWQRRSDNLPRCLECGAFHQSYATGCPLVARGAHRILLPMSKGGDA